MVSVYFQTWDDNLANLAQMWANKCIWEHGFVEFGDQYPYPVSFKGQIGIYIFRIIRSCPVAHVTAHKAQ